MFQLFSGLILVTIMGVSSSQVWAAPLKCTGDGWEIITTDRYLTDAILTENGADVERGLLGCSRGVGEFKYFDCSSGSERLGGFRVHITFGNWNDWEPLYDPQNSETFEGLLFRRIPGASIEKIADLECRLN
jgi:hypothetical protein